MRVIVIITCPCVFFPWSQRVLPCQVRTWGKEPDAPFLCHMPSAHLITLVSWMFLCGFPLMCLRREWSSWLEIVAFAFWLITQDFLQRGVSSPSCLIISFRWLPSLYSILCGFYFSLYSRKKKNVLRCQEQRFREVAGAQGLSKV